MFAAIVFTAIPSWSSDRFRLTQLSSSATLISAQRRRGAMGDGSDDVVRRAADWQSVRDQFAALLQLGLHGSSQVWKGGDDQLKRALGDFVKEAVRKTQNFGERDVPDATLSPAHTGRFRLHVVMRSGNASLSRRTPSHAR